MGRYRNEEAPNCYFPTDNDFDIPTLKLDMCATFLDQPFVRWGRLNKHSVRNAKSIHFYTVEPKFSGLWSRPHLLSNLPVINVTEVNFDLHNSSPYWLAMWRTGQKRWMSYFWGTRGKKLFVDLSVPEKFQELNMIGVPLHWTAFMTRGYNGTSEAKMMKEYALAEEWASGDAVNFVVYGGDKKVRALCQRNEFQWIPEDAHLYSKRQTHKDEVWEKTKLESPQLAELPQSWKPWVV